MRILLIHRYFWPDTPPYAVILKKIAKRLASEGHDVIVLSTQPAYKPEVENFKQPGVEAIDGYRVVRVSLPGLKFLPSAVAAALAMILFCLRIIGHGIVNRRYQLVMISTSPPVLAGVSARLIARFSRARFFYHCMDIHPEIGRLSGEFANPLIYRMMQSVDNSTCNSASRVLVLSNDMRDAIVKRSGVDQGNIEVMQNFNLNNHVDKQIDCPIEYRKTSDCFRLIFAGNIGRFQGLESIVESFINLPNINAELVFLGEGKLKAELQARVASSGIDRVKFFPHQTMEIANEIIRTADAGIVSLSEGVYQYAYPTKVISYLSVACPLLVIIEPQSDMARFVRNNEIGICVDINNADSLSDGISTLTSNVEMIAKYKTNALNVYNTYYNEQLVLDKWAELVNQVRKSSN